MDYKMMATELLEYLIEAQKMDHIFLSNITKIAKGEDAVIRYLQVDNNGATALEISERFGINTSRVAAILNSLSKKGYIERQVDLYDKRKIHVYITESGIEYGNKKYEEVLSKLAMLFETLGEKDVSEFIRIQKRIIDIVSDKQIKL